MPALLGVFNCASHGVLLVFLLVGMQEWRRTRTLTMLGGACRGSLWDPLLHLLLTARKLQGAAVQCAKVKDVDGTPSKSLQETYA